MKNVERPAQSSGPCADIGASRGTCGARVCAGPSALHGPGSKPTFAASGALAPRRAAVRSTMPTMQPEDITRIDLNGLTAKNGGAPL